MAITYTVKINGTDITPYLKGPGGYKIGKPKLWSEADRAMSGNLNADYIGKFPKNFLEFKSLTTAEMQIVGTLLDLPTFTVIWYDPSSGTYKSGLFYAGDFTVSLMSLSLEVYEPFTVNLIAFNKL